MSIYKIRFDLEISLSFRVPPKVQRQVIGPRYLFRSNGKPQLDVWKIVKGEFFQYTGSKKPQKNDLSQMVGSLVFSESALSIVENKIGHSGNFFPLKRTVDHGLYLMSLP